MYIFYNTSLVSYRICFYLVKLSQTSSTINTKVHLSSICRAILKKPLNGFLMEADAPTWYGDSWYSHLSNKRTGWNKRGYINEKVSPLLV